MNGANGDTRDGHAGKDVTADLESTHGQGCIEDSTGWWTEPGETNGRGHEKGAKGSDKEELDKGEGDRVAKLIHDGLSGVG